jgi:hypothetical protein
VSKTTVINWDREFTEEIDNLRAGEREAMYQTNHISTRKKLEFFGDFLSRIQRELETRDVPSIQTEKLFAVYPHFCREAQHAVPEIEFRDEDDARVEKSERGTRSDILAY